MKLNFNLTNRLNSFTLRAVLVSALVAGGTIAEAQTTYTWVGSAGDNSWSNKNNWSPVRETPAVTDVLYLSGTSVSAPVVNFDITNPSETIGVLYVRQGAMATINVANHKSLILAGNGATNADFYVDATSKLTIGNSVAGAALDIQILTGNTGRVDGELELISTLGNAVHQLTAADVNAMRFIAGSTFISGTNLGGHPFGNSSTNSKVLFQLGSTYINEGGSHPFGSGTVATVTFQTGSTYIHRSNSAINLGGRYYGDVIIDQPNYVGVAEGLTGVFNVENLTMLQGTSLTVPHDAGTIIRGNITVNSGSLIFSPSGSSQNFLFRGTAVQTLQASGTGQLIFGTNCKVIVEAGYQVQLQSNITVRNLMNVWGQLDAQNYVIGSDVTTGSFTLVSGGTLYTSHPDGIYKSAALGTVQVPGNRSYATGTYRYYGNLAQQTGDGIPATVNILTIENPAGVTLGKKVKVINQLNLISGKLYTTTNTLVTLDYTGEVSFAGSTSFVHGPMAIVVAQANPDAFQFPIGKGNDYRPVSLAVVHNDATATTYTAELFTGAPPARTLPASLKMVSSTRYFTITKSPDAALISGYITMPFTTDEGMGVLHPEGVRIAKSNGTAWVDLGGTYNSGELNIASSNSFTTFSDFVLARTSSTLPVSLISLNAASEKENVLVNWATSKEENNAYFEVQRSADGQNFQTIGKVEGMGNSANENNYAFTDNQPLAGLAYYRLRQVDFDGTASFHGPVAVRRATGAIGQLALYPNPAVQSATLTFDAETDQVATIRIVNTIGQTVVQQSVSATKGNNSVALPAEKLATGMYIVEMITETGTTATRLIKQ